MDIESLSVVVQSLLPLNLKNRETTAIEINNKIMKSKYLNHIKVKCIKKVIIVFFYLMILKES